MIAAIAFFVALGGSVYACRSILGWLVHREILDHPNERSSHETPTPRGGGLAVVPVLLVVMALLVAARAAPTGVLVIVVAAAGLLAISWKDDRGGMSRLARLGCHALAVIVGLAIQAPQDLVFQGWVSFPLDRLLAFLAWVWFVNLFNFMDGIDGISGVEAGCLGCGLALVAALAGGFPAPALAVAGVALGFLYWNWSPARMFLGDSGSVPLGYILGWLLLQAAFHGEWAAALILPLYYLTDATLTLLRRALRREKIFEAHRQHFYQIAVRGGASHAQVAGVVLGGNLLLVLAALASLTYPLPSLIMAAAVVGGMLIVLTRMGEVRAA